MAGYVLCGAAYPRHVHVVTHPLPTGRSSDLLSQCTLIARPPLDDDGRREVLGRRARRRGLAIDEAAIDWLLRRLDRDLSSLARLPDQLDRASLAEQRRITVPFLPPVLGGDASHAVPSRLQVVVPSRRRRRDRPTTFFPQRGHCRGVQQGSLTGT